MYSTHTACRLAGVSYRQADYWDRVGLVRPTITAHGSGSRRAYDSVDVALLAVAGRLARFGLPLSSLNLTVLRDAPRYAWLDGYLVVGDTGDIRLQSGEIRVDGTEEAVVVIDLCAIARSLGMVGDQLIAGVPDSPRREPSLSKLAASY